MKAKIKYTNGPMEAKVIQDYLPPPEELAFREEGMRVTIALSKKSVAFFLNLKQQDTLPNTSV